ncbi:hypothetical protein V2J09_013777 [Rumex salicifolius]
MDGLEVSGSPLAWSWIIEALATHSEVELKLLWDIIQSVPNLSDNLNEEAREMIALRSLESLFDPAIVLNSSVPTFSDQEDIQFDSSESFSHVLKCVTDQLSVSSLRKDGVDPLPNLRKRASDKLVREVHAYIERRKASMPKCALQELSDILQKGDACHETDLKRERSCLQTQERMQDRIVEAQSGEPPPKKKPRHDNNGSIASAEQSTSPLISSDIQDCPIDGQSDKLLPRKKRRHNSNGSILSTEQNLAPLISSVMQDCPVDVRCGFSPPGRKLRHDSNESFSSEKNSAHVISSGMQDCPVDGQSGKSPPERNLRHDSRGSIASTEKNSDPLISPDNSQPYPLSSKPAQPIGLLTWGPSDGLKVDEERNAENSSTAADTAEQDVCIKCHQGGEMLICSMSSCPVVVHERCLGITDCIDNRDNFICPFCACSSAKSEYTEAKKKMLLAREKLTLFVGGNPDHQPKGFTEANANPPSQDRVDRTFKRKGVYQVDQSSTDKQQEVHLARDDVRSSTPKCLSKQGEGITGNNCQVDRQFTNVNPSSSRQGRDKRNFKGKSVDQAPTDKPHEGHLSQDDLHTSPLNCSSKEGQSTLANSCQFEKRYIPVKPNPPRQGCDESTFKGKGNVVHQVLQASIHEHHKGYLATDNVHNSPPNPSLEEGEDITAKNCQLAKGDQIKPIEHFQFARRSRRIRTQERLDNLSKNASFTSSGNLNGSPETKNHTAKISDNFLSPQSQRKLADLQGASTASLDDCDIISEEETTGAPTSKLPQRFKSVARKSYRPNRVPWTEEEVEMLKEGMKRFGSGDMRIIPWTDILEFGSSVFWKGRTGVNLKDKWRNLNGELNNRIFDIGRAQFGSGYWTRRISSTNLWALLTLDKVTFIHVVCNVN